jgi:hypothetical protein
MFVLTSPVLAPPMPPRITVDGSAVETVIADADPLPPGTPFAVEPAPPPPTVTVMFVVR